MTDFGPGREFDYLRAVAARLGPRARGLGDDCAVVERGDGSPPLVVSVDLSIEGVHFQRDWLTPGEIGGRATAASLSDLAAAGADPVGVLVSLGVPSEDGDLIEAIMNGVGETVDRWGGHVLGGDLTRAPAISIDVVALGMAAAGGPPGRGGARPGDVLWVTGVLGGARAALHAWQRDVAPHPRARTTFAAPEPRLAAGRWLVRHGARAMLDLSDGLAGDVQHLAARSDVSAAVDLDTLPLGPGVAEAAKAEGERPEVFAAQGGEDYELLVALPPSFGDEGKEAFRAECGIALTAVGTVDEGRGVRFLPDGLPRGYDHFA